MMRHILIGFFFLTGCEYLISNQQSDTHLQAYQKPVPNISQANGGIPTTESVPQEESVWGQVKCATESTQEIERFNLQVRQFLSTSQDPNKLPGIGCLNQHRGGFFFRGAIAFEGIQNLNLSQLNNMAQTTILKSSYIEIYVDTGQKQEGNLNYKTVAPIKLFAAPTGNVIDANQATLNFADTKGTVSLVGSIGQEVFTGEFRYNNHTTWQQTLNGYSGTIGPFEIRTCKFFKCN